MKPPFLHFVGNAYLFPSLFLMRTKKIEKRKALGNAPIRDSQDSPICWIIRLII